MPSSHPAGIPVQPVSPEGQRLLPPEIAGLGGNDVGYPFLCDADLGAAETFFNTTVVCILSGQVRVVELVRVTYAFILVPVQVGPTERVAASSGEVRERHLL